MSSTVTSQGLVNRGTLKLIDQRSVSYTKPTNSTSQDFTAYVNTGGSFDRVYRVVMIDTGFEEELTATRFTSSGLLELKAMQYIHRSSGSLNIVIDTPNVASSLFYGPAATFDFRVQVFRLELV